MITLYAKTGCQYCARVIEALDARGLSFMKKNVRNASVLEELEREGGKRQTPFLIDGDVRLYDSQAIIEYLHKAYGHEGSPQVRITDAGDVCPSS